MPGQELVAAHADAPGDDGEGRRGPGSLVTRTDRPIIPGLIALLAALAFALARWQTWAHGSIGRFILVGRRFATPSQLPHGIPLSPTYGYDGQFFYRLALNPVNFSHIAYGIRVDQPYRYMRIGYPWLTWLASFGQHVLVPVMLVAVNIVAIGAMGYLGGMFARQGGRHALAGLVLPAYFGLVTSLSRDTAEPLAAVCLLGRAARHPRPPPAAGRVDPRLRRADQGIGHRRRGRRGHRPGHGCHPRSAIRATRARRPGLGPSGRGVRWPGRSW